MISVLNSMTFLCLVEDALCLKAQGVLVFCSCQLYTDVFQTGSWRRRLCATCVYWLLPSYTTTYLERTAR